MAITGSEIVVRIDQRIAELGFKRAYLYEKLDIAPNTLSNWSKRGTVPPADVALGIADALDCSVRWLLTGKDEKGFSNDERTLVNKYRLLSDQDQFEVKALVEAKLTPAKREQIPELLTAGEKKLAAG